MKDVQQVAEGYRGISINLLISWLASVTRLWATGMVFYKHFNGMTIGMTPKGVYMIFLVFFFWAGYYAVHVMRSPGKWLEKRITRIFIPYWLVVIPIAIANQVISYKDVSIESTLCLLTGMTFFADEKLYILTWFITVLLMMYLATFGVFIMKRWMARAVVFCVLTYAVNSAGVYLETIGHYVGGFVLGYGVMKSGLGSKEFFCRVSMFDFFERQRKLIMMIHNYSYEFYLVHGAVLIFILKMVKMDGLGGFVLAFALTGMMSIGVKVVSDWILTWSILQSRLGTRAA